MILIYQTNSLKTLNNFQSLKKSMTLLFTSMMTFLQIPLLMVIICVFFLDYKDEDKTLKIITYSFAAFNALLFLLVTFILFKLFIIRIPSFNIPWSASNT